MVKFIEILQSYLQILIKLTLLFSFKKLIWISVVGSF